MSFDQVIAHYRNFKQIVPGKAEEKQIFKEFEQNSGYNSYQVIKEATTQNKPTHIQQKQHKNIGAPTRRLSKRKPTNNASWGGAPTKEMQQAFPRTKQVGVAPTWRSSVRNPTSKTS